MARNYLPQVTYEQKKNRIYSQKELYDFDEYLKNFQKPHTLLSGEIVSRVDWKEVYLDQNVTTNEGKVIVLNPTYGMNKFGEIHMQSNEIPQIELENKIEQWKFWKGGKEYGEQKKLEQLDTTLVGKIPSYND